MSVSLISQPIGKKDLFTGAGTVVPLVLQVSLSLSLSLSRARARSFSLAYSDPLPPSLSLSLSAAAAATATAAATAAAAAVFSIGGIEPFSSQSQQVIAPIPWLPDAPRGSSVWRSQSGVLAATWAASSDGTSTPAGFLSLSLSVPLSLSVSLSL